MFCREAVASLGVAEPAIRARGGRLCFVGNGTVPMAQDFAEQFHVAAPLFTDPSRRAFQAAGMKRRFGLGLGTLRAGARAVAAGHVQGRTAGDPWQQGGVLVIGPDGVERYRQNADDAGTELQIPPILAALA